MSLLKWQEMAKSKSALGKKINFVHNTITKKKLGDETSQIGFEKMFTPITTKLDDVIASNLGLLPLPQPARRKKAKKAEIDYPPEVDPFENMDIEGLFDEAVPPEPEKQIPASPPASPFVSPPTSPPPASPAAAAAPPTYEEIVEEVGENPPEYKFATPDYALEPEDGEIEEDESNQTLNDLKLENYESAEKVLFEEDLTNFKKRKYILKLISEAKYRRNQLKGYKTSWTMKFKKGNITEEQKEIQHERIDRTFKVVNSYIKYFQNRMKQFAGSGLRRKKGGTISFFSNPKDLLQKLEVIVGSILAGNTNLGIRNTGVGILDLLLKEGAINKSQHEKIFRKYFKP